MINTTINFGGFYESIHDDQIEWAIESYYSDDNGVFNYDEIADKIDYKKIKHDYSKSYCNLLTNWIQDNYGVNIFFDNIKLSSPREYNFETDKIVCDVSESAIESLINRFKDDETFLEYLKDRTKSYDGFISFYTYQDALDNKNNILSVYILEYLANKFETDDFLEYYDRAYMYDNIYQSLLGV
jgi:hypothetical protein